MPEAFVNLDFVGGIDVAWAAPSMTPKCSTEYVLLEAPLTLADLARHLATRKNFLFHPCGSSVVRALEVVARPYGYTVTFDAEQEVACLQHFGSAPLCDCDSAASHLSARQQLKLLLRR